MRATPLAAPRAAALFVRLRRCLLPPPPRAPAGIIGRVPNQPQSAYNYRRHNATKSEGTQNVLAIIFLARRRAYRPRRRATARTRQDRAWIGGEDVETGTGHEALEVEAKGCYGIAKLKG
ncbi:hypothetical protein ACP70R_025243 [Stipagrostis hirtigluma subsp. patula]